MNKYAFTSIILLFTFIPIEIYNARLINVEKNSCFFEESKSLLTSSWKHTRLLEATDDGCTVNDTIDITLRCKLFYPLFSLLLKLVFSTRHKNLEKMHNKFKVKL